LKSQFAIDNDGKARLGLEINFTSASENEISLRVLAASDASRKQRLSCIELLVPLASAMDIPGTIFQLKQIFIRN
jgi:hypothetical protein